MGILRSSCVVPKMFAGWLLLAILVADSDAAAQQIIPTEGGRVSVAADGVPLQELLDRFAELLNLRLQLQPGLGERQVTAKLESLPILNALYGVLQAADVDFGLAAATARRPMTLIVIDSQAPEPTSMPADSAETAIVEPKVEPAPAQVIEPEQGDQQEADIAIAAGNESGTTIPPEMASAERLVQLLAPARQAKPSAGAWIALPFIGPDGQPYTVQNYPPPAGVVQLPFPDASGQPLELVVRPSKPGQVTLPFPGRDGQPYTIPATTERYPQPQKGGR